MRLRGGIARWVTMTTLLLSVGAVPEVLAKGKPGGGGGSGSCASLGFNTFGDDRLDTSINYQNSEGAVPRDHYSFELAYEIDNPIPEADAQFGNAIDTWWDPAEGTFLAVAAPHSKRVDIFELNAAGASAPVSVPLEPDVPASQAWLSVHLEDLAGDPSPDLIVTSGTAQKGWVYLGPDYTDVAAVLTPTLIPGVLDADRFGRDTVAFDTANGQLYIAASSADAGGTRGAIFRCDLAGANGLGDDGTDALGRPFEHCGAQSLPEGIVYTALGKIVTLGEVDGNPNNGPELLVAANGSGNGKKKSDPRILVYRPGSGDLGQPIDELVELVRKFDGFGRFTALDYATPFGTDEIVISEFHSPGWIWPNADPNAAVGLPLDANLVFQYGNSIDSSSLSGAESLVVVGGAGAPEACSGGPGANDGFAYLYVFDGSGVAPTLVDTVQAPNGEGRDFGWDVAATGSDLVVIAERRSDVNGVLEAGKVYVYKYVELTERPPSP